MVEISDAQWAEFDTEGLFAPGTNSARRHVARHAAAH